MRLDERIPCLVSELKLDNISPHFWPKKSKADKIGYFASFRPFLGQKWGQMLSNFSSETDQIWNPLIKAHLLNPQNERVTNTLFFDPHCDFKTLVARGRVGMKI